TFIEAQLCRDEEVVVVGGGNSAGQAAVFLAQTAKRVHMLVRADGLAETMSRYLIRRIEQSPAIDYWVFRVNGVGSKPCLMDHVRRAPEVAEHAVGMRDEQRPARFEDREIGVGRAGHQSGSSPPANSSAGAAAQSSMRGRSPARGPPYRKDRARDT